MGVRLVDLSERIKAKARELGAAEIGVGSAFAVSHTATSLQAMLPGCRSVVCILFPHSETTLGSSDSSVKQYDTTFCYNEVASISHQLSRLLETEGYPALAVPAFLPLDMSDGKMGMVGAVDWKQTAVKSGLAVWGKSGLAVNFRFGPRFRLGGIITSAELKPDEEVDFSPCDNCRLCVESCPASALLGDGRIDKKRCGEYLFSYGLRAFARLLVGIATAKDRAEVKELAYSYRTRELWQALETGNYYHCWNCQSICAIGRGHSYDGQNTSLGRSDTG